MTTVVLPWEIPFLATKFWEGVSVCAEGGPKIARLVLMSWAFPDTGGGAGIQESVNP